SLFTLCPLPTLASSQHSRPIALPSAFFFLITPPPPTSPLFPYTTLFRSLTKFQPRIANAAEFARNRRVLLLQSDSGVGMDIALRSEEHTSELQSLTNLVCRLLLEKKNKNHKNIASTA